MNSEIFKLSDKQLGGNIGEMCRPLDKQLISSAKLNRLTEKDSGYFTNSIPPKI
jgi:hypothetical protein